MKRPARSRFMGIDYSLSFLPQVGEGEKWGETDHSLMNISVEDGLSHDKEREIVLHEILHQLMGLGHLELSPEDEERVATFMGTALIGHMRDNITLWRYLIKKPPK
jgi:hypothetical protein